MTSLKFGTSGLRGLVTELVGRPAYDYARAFCEMIREDVAVPPGGAVMIGRDLRASSPEIALLCAQAATAAGFAPVDCGAVPTPALALASMRAGAPAIMVTGSHIPEDRNGLKFYRREGEINKADEARILAWHGRIAGAPIDASGGFAATRDVLAPYRQRYTDFFGPGALAGLRVGVYQHSSVGRDLICAVLTELGAEAVPLGRANVFIPVDTEALRPDDVELAAGWAAEQRFDAIVSTDGDADRPLVSDEAGRFLRGDLIGVLTANALSADVVVTPVTSNSAIEKSGFFASVLRTKVGSPFVIAGMETGMATARCIVGFEANGGVLLGSDVMRGEKRLDRLVTRDAMLPILACLEQVVRRGKPLSAIAAELAFAVALSDRIPETPAERSADLIARLEGDSAFRNQAFARRGGVAAIDQRDGLRLTLGDGATAHFRPSGNAPELRVYVEAPTEADAAELLQDCLAFARREVAAR